MTQELVTFVARIKAKRGREAEVKQELLKLIAPTRAEAGCVSYDMHVSLENPAQFLFYETWKSQKDIDAHFETPHLKSVLAKVSDSLAEPPELTRWQKIVS